jgi:hypothetical protein
MLNHIPTFFSKKLPLATASEGTSFRCLPFKALLRLVEDARKKEKILLINSVVLPKNGAVAGENIKIV